MRHRPDAIIVQSESAEYTHHVVASPSHDVKLRNKLIFLSLDLLYSKSPDADVLMFAQDNGMTPRGVHVVHELAPAGFQVMGNDYYGHNEKLLLPDGTMTYGEDVLGWYLITLPLLPPLLQARHAHRDQHAAPRTRRPWLWKQWTNVLRMRRDGDSGAGLHLVQPDRSDGLGHATGGEARPRERLRAL